MQPNEGWFWYTILKDNKTEYTELIYDLIRIERDRQVSLWGTEDAMINREGFDSYIRTKCLVLAEEFGEVVKDTLDHKPLKDIATEIVQTAAVCVAMLEGIHLYGA